MQNMKTTSFFLLYLVGIKDVEMKFRMTPMTGWMVAFECLKTNDVFVTIHRIRVNLVFHVLILNMQSVPALRYCSIETRRTAVSIRTLHVRGFTCTL